jgi:hypothetical protein
MATGLFLSKTNRRKAAVAQLLSHSTTWRAIEMVLLDCFRQKQTVNNIKNYIVFNGSSGLFLSKTNSKQYKKLYCF